MSYYVIRLPTSIPFKEGMLVDATPQSHISMGPKPVWRLARNQNSMGSRNKSQAGISSRGIPKVAPNLYFLGTSMHTRGSCKCLWKMSTAHTYYNEDLWFDHQKEEWNQQNLEFRLSITHIYTVMTHNIYMHKYIVCKVIRGNNLQGGSGRIFFQDPEIHVWLDGEYFEVPFLHVWQLVGGNN